ncbi:hypothetical protein ASZ90_009708 [hydrocarbon metagenome]|uniref:Uncharacterized protein n=1 Tax=hydrocarbon metagenome TaxID=938273 RepID=A0A0W8FI38_9ZZZZ
MDGLKDRPPGHKQAAVLPGDEIGALRGGDLGERHRTEPVPGIAHPINRDAVCIQQPPLEIVDEDRIAGGIKERPVPRLALPQLLLERRTVGERPRKLLLRPPAPEGVPHDVCGARDHRKIALRPLAGTGHVVKPHEPDERPGDRDRHDQERPDRLPLQDLLLGRRFGRQGGDIKDMDRFSRPERRHPPCDALCRDTLEAVDLRADTRCAPLVGVVEHRAAVADTEEVGAVGAGEVADLIEHRVDRGVGILHPDKPGRNGGDLRLDLEPPRKRRNRPLPAHRLPDLVRQLGKLHPGIAALLEVEVRAGVQRLDHHLLPPPAGEDDERGCAVL